MEQHIKSQLELSRNYHDTSGIDKLRRAAKSGDKGALQEAAQQFEAVFVNMMLKSMRKAQDAMADKDSPFNSQQVKFYRDMHDQQLAVDMASSGTIGLADVIIQQLDPNGQGVTPAGVGRSNGNLEDIKQFGTHVLSKSQESSPTIEPAQKKSVFENIESFVQNLLPAAQNIAKQLGIEPKAMLAQAAVETGWGKHIIHSGDGENSHNLFGIKADSRWQGEKASINTLEYEQGVAKQEKASFRKYGSFEDSMQDYVDFVKENPRYKQAVDKADDPIEYFTELQNAGYATDSSYAKKIMAVLDSVNFKQAIQQSLGL